MMKTEVVTVPGFGGRDDGKNFKITEMPAAQAEKWALRMFIVLKGTTGNIPFEYEHLGIVGVAIRGLNAFLAADVNFALLEPLLDEMMTCVQIVRDWSNFPSIATPLLPDDIQDVKTRMWLRSEVLRIHTNFSIADGLSELVAVVTRPVSPIT